MSSRSEIAVVGLGAMGANLARNFASRGRRAVGFDLDPSAGARLVAEHADPNLGVESDWRSLVARLDRPRRLIVLVPAGAPVDSVLDTLDPLLEDEDVVVDAGNSHYADTARRIVRAEESPWRFVGMGVSGGAEGALRGPSMMPGGDPQAWATLEVLLREIAAVSAHGPCVAHCGRGAAGHFVKMVHNGIEYGDMQLLAEARVLLRSGLRLADDDVAGAFERWSRGPLESFLVSITVDILRARDPEGEGLLVDAILDRAGQKGTGTWTVASALELGVAVPTIAAAVAARVQSSEKALRVEGAQRLARTLGAMKGATVDDVEAAVRAARIATYAQGFALLAAGSEAHAFDSDLAEIARIWTGGCIIRAALLERVLEVLRAEHAPTSLALALADDLRELTPALRRTVSAAAAAGVPVPALSASLGWVDTLATEHGSANLIQAQRDSFGNHTYERVDRPGVKVHTDWKRG